MGNWPSGNRLAMTSLFAVALILVVACIAPHPVGSRAGDDRPSGTDQEEGHDRQESPRALPSQPADADGVVEGALPAPAVWVEANRHADCAVAWLSETDHVTWTTEGRTPVVSERPGELARRREESFRRFPRGPSVRCEVTAAGRLRCGYHRCMDPAILVGTQPPPQCRSEYPVYASADVSDVQRTEEFTPARPWWLYGPVAPMERMRNPANHFACVRVDASIRCYPVRRDNRTPTSVHSPELDALDDLIDLAGAGSTACAVRSDGSVVCWGAQLSRDPNVNPEDSPALELPDSPDLWIPRRIDGLPPSVVQVSVGETRACARTHDGRVFCWGDVACMAQCDRSATPG